jgi:hypothetical protein
LTGFFKKTIKQEAMVEFRYEKKEGEIRPVRMKPTAFSKAYDGVIVVGLDADRNNEERHYYLKNIDIGTLKIAKEIQMNKKQIASALIKIAKQLVTKELSVPEKHQEKIALKTLKMPDAMVGVMGGMTKEEAREFLKKIGYSNAQIAKLEK